jgi:hypothetical protein
LQPAVRYGVDAVVSWIEGTLDTDTSTAIEVTGRQGQYAIDFVNTYSAELMLAPTPVDSNNTVIRDQIDQAVADVIDNPKIPTLEYANVAAIEADVIASVKAAELIANVANINITVLPSNPDDGVFRFSPGARQG